MTTPSPAAHPKREPPYLVERADGLHHLSPTHAAAFLGLVRAGEALERGLDADLRAGHGISLRAFEVLLHLAVFSPDGSLPMAQLTRQAPLSQSRISRLVAELETRGFVSRSTSTDDSRGVTVAITARGRDKLRAAHDPHYRDLHARLFSRLTWEETVALADLTAKLLRDADETVRSAAPRR
ncbi:hypothetical protein BH20ACT8_BH20ACT8_17670 [soil metagenome]